MAWKKAYRKEPVKLKLEIRNATHKRNTASREVVHVKHAELDAYKQADELKDEVVSLKSSLKDANQSERYTMQTLATIKKRMEEDTTSPHNAEIEISILKGMIGSMDNEMATYKFFLR